MSRERIVRVVAGSFVVASVALGWLVSPYFLLFTLFVGLNLLQSGLTRWCLMEDVLKALGVKGACDGAAAPGGPAGANRGGETGA